MCEIVKNVRNSETLRKSFNELAIETFDLDFEDWYQNGFWRDKYIPYSMVIDGKVAANVSVNRTDMLWNGRRKHLIQLGTVMTKKAYRNRGLILYNIFAPERVDPEAVAKAFGNKFQKLSLCFVPWENSGYEKELLCKEDNTFFVKGELFAEFERERLRFPDLAHA